MTALVIVPPRYASGASVMTMKKIVEITHTFKSTFPTFSNSPSLRQLDDWGVLISVSKVCRLQQVIEDNGSSMFGTTWIVTCHKFPNFNWLLFALGRKIASIFVLVSPHVFVSTILSKGIAIDAWLVTVVWWKVGCHRQSAWRELLSIVGCHAAISNAWWSTNLLT